MSARVIDGKAVAEEVRERVALGVSEFAAERDGTVPGLATVLVGDDPASHVYVGNKRKQTEQVGMRSIHHGLPAETTTADLLGLVEALNREGTTVFLTTQYLEEADQLADRVGIIARGKLVAEGTPASLKAEVGKPHLEIGLSEGSAEQAEQVCATFGRHLPERDGKVLVELDGGATEVAKVVRALDEAGIAVESLDLVEPSLDDVFVATTGEHLEGDEPDADASSASRPGGSGAESGAAAEAG